MRWSDPTTNEYQAMNFHGWWAIAMMIVLGCSPVGLAQETGAAGAAGGGGGGGEAAPQGGGGGMDIWLLMLMPAAVVLFMLLIMRPQQKEHKRREEMLKELKKNDRVVTAAGIVAKIASIKPENQTVKLILDENSGSCMTVTMSSIARVLTGEEKGDLNSAS